jgi:hypothetical protein
VAIALLGRDRVSLDFLQLLKAILAPSIDFGLLNPLAVRGLDVQGKFAPTAVEVVRAKKGVISGRMRKRNE